jgi:hypothetical protein
LLSEKSPFFIPLLPQLVIPVPVIDRNKATAGKTAITFSFPDYGNIWVKVELRGLNRFCLNCLMDTVMPKNPYAHQLINNLIEAAQKGDPQLINEFLAFAIEAGVAHLDLIEDTLPLKDLLHRQRVVSQGTLLLTLFNCLPASTTASVKQEGLTLRGRQPFHQQ